MKKTYFVLSIFMLIATANFQLHAQSYDKILGKVNAKDDSWFASKEAKHIADNVLFYQNEDGGWPKNFDMSKDPDLKKLKNLKIEGSHLLASTIDNGATHTQMWFLAKVYEATGEEKYKAAFLNGVDYLLEAQYDNGGWPQFYPLREGYYEHITLNDGAMIGVMKLLQAIARNQKPVDFVDKERMEKARLAVEKGVDVLLKMQVPVNGKLTIWCAQHDEHTLLPANARAYELISLSGQESVGVVEFLMGIKNPGERVERSIRSAVQWFEDHKVMGEKVEWVKDPSYSEGKDRIVVQDSSAGPLWGRFNDIETGEPFFVGRDGVKKKHLADIEEERRAGYNYIDNYAEKLLKEDYPEWEKKH
ncbi:pectate lyase [Christiangramia fulva]|uniref:Pectate lyase n=1 Tax=Christiangramia fulva TaxID=2126553 RepID=A0A2R3Z5V6_9FLAO|nr:pectate lyase [Christiangramia fulva]AVR45663.1 pectate lyase [Christiangramia fulva]